MNIGNKGQEFEELVCSLLNRIGFRIVRRNYLLPDRTGEIDLICEDQNTGVRIAVECKNQETPVDVKELSWFVDKMEKLGIRHGILISRGKVSENVYEQVQYYLKKREVRIAILENVDRIVYGSDILTLKGMISRALNLSEQSHLFVRKNVIFNEKTIPKQEPEFLKAKYEHLTTELKLELRPVKLFEFNACIEIFEDGRKRIISGTGMLAFDLVTGRVIKEKWFYKDLRIGLSNYHHKSYDFSILARNTGIIFSPAIARVDEEDANEHICKFLKSLYSENNSYVKIKSVKIKESTICHYPVWHVHYLTLDKIRNLKLTYEHIYSGVTGNEIFDSLFRSGFPPLWYCEICNEDEILRAAYICHVCGRPICENHAIKCGDLSCERVFCEECVENEDVADYVSRCSAPSCSIFCWEHKPKNVCYICNEFFCEDHSLQCKYCKSIVCESHSVRCQNCGKVMCHRCKNRYSYEERRFWILKKYYCNECITGMELDFR